MEKQLKMEKQLEMKKQLKKEKPLDKRRGYGVVGLRQINICRKVPLQVNFLRWAFCIAIYESYVSMALNHRISWCVWISNIDVK
jgi:hypothetical protein